MIGVDFLREWTRRPRRPIHGWRDLPQPTPVFLFILVVLLTVSEGVSQLLRGSVVGILWILIGVSAVTILFLYLRRPSE